MWLILCVILPLSFKHVFKREIGDSARYLSNCFLLQERVGNFLADFYSVNGLVLESRKRREHLSEEDILRNKAIMESLSKGGNIVEQNYEVSQLSNMAEFSFPQYIEEKRGLPQSDSRKRKQSQGFTAATIFPELHLVFYEVIYCVLSGVFVLSIASSQTDSHQWGSISTYWPR